MAEKTAVAELTEEVKQRRDLVLRNLQEFLGTDKLEKQLSTEGKVPHVYWGTATTGKPHVGYMVPMQKIADFLQAGLKVTILFADLHAFLDNMKSTWELLENRVIYYEHVIKSLLQSLDIPIDRLHFVRGTTYQLSREYTSDLLRLCGQVSQRDALKAGAEVVKQVDSPLLSGLLYPLLQALDEQYLKVDGQFGGVDQRKIFILAEEQLPKLKLGKRWHLMNPMVPGLTGGKMSSSEADSKIDLLDSLSTVNQKVMNAACPKQIEDNGVLSFFKSVLLPIAGSVDINNKNYTKFDDIGEDFVGGKLDEQHLKETLSNFLCDLLSKVQERCRNDAVESALEKGYQTVPERKVVLSSRSPVELQEDQRTFLKTLLEDSEVIGADDYSIRSALVENRPLNIVFPIHAKGKFHLGFVSALLKFKRLAAEGVKFSGTVLISDIEGFLDGEKVPWGAREARSEYFRVIVDSFIKALSLQEVVRTVLASSLAGYFNSDYVLDMYKMACAVTRDETSVCEGSALSGNLVPIFFALNIRLTNADVVLIGNESDAKTIAELTVKLLNAVGSHAPTQITVPVIPGCDGLKMSSRSADFILDPLDTPKQTKTKIARSFCEPQNLTGNVAMQLAKLIVFPLLNGKNLEISRSDDNGGNISVGNYDGLEQEFLVGSNPAFPLHPGDLKNAVVNSINGLFDPVRTELGSVQQRLLAAAFPSNKGGKKK